MMNGYMPHRGSWFVGFCLLVAACGSPADGEPVTMLPDLGVGDRPEGVAFEETPTEMSVTTITMVTSPITPPSTEALPGVSQRVLVPVGVAGTVEFVLEGQSLRLLAVNSAEGWATEIGPTPPGEIDVSFRQPTRRFDFNAEPDDGLIRTRIRERVETASSIDRAADPMTFDVRAAGSVSLLVKDGRLVVRNVNTSPGWIHQVKADGDQLRVEFVNGTDQVRFEARLGDGAVTTEIRTESFDHLET